VFPGGKIKIKILLELINSVKSQGTKSTYKKSVAFLYTLTNTHIKGNFDNHLIYNRIKGNIILLI
jgi:hypothetical protein